MDAVAPRAVAVAAFGLGVVNREDVAELLGAGDLRPRTILRAWDAYAQKRFGIVDFQIDRLEPVTVARLELIEPGESVNAVRDEIDVRICVGGDIGPLDQPRDVGDR
ncbi:MAG: hypothetical protein IJL17_09945 [Kiritimatiellae bacterium]|nr:hypothetical protein [Kiritimatiellia bacterium]